MPPRSATPLRKRTVLLSEPNEYEFQKRYKDPTNKRAGTRYGEFNALVNQLLAVHFRENPIITGAELDRATAARSDFGDSFAVIQEKTDER